MTGANVARAMQLSPPTVHEMIGRLIDDGYIAREPDKSLVHRRGPGARRGHRHAPPAHRAFPHRRPRDPLGRGPRGGRADGARDVAEARGAHARGDRRRQDLPARPPDRARGPDSRFAARRLRGRRQGARSSASRTRPKSFSTTSAPPGSSRAWRQRSRAATTKRSSITSADGDTPSPHSVAETVSVVADPAPPPRAALPQQLVLSRDKYGR